jgi:threonine dehydrogenase-like Zn-dependent dehydrogenase
MILSGKLMLEHLGERQAAQRLERAVATVIAEGTQVTYDLKPARDDPTAVGTSEYADAIIASSPRAASVVRDTESESTCGRKVTVVGAGNVGATCAQEIARRDYADVVLVDIIPNFRREGARHEPGGLGARLRADAHGLERYAETEARTSS